MIDPATAERISRAWCSSVVEGDLAAFESLYDPQAVIWTNQGGTYSLTHHLAVVRKLKSITEDWAYNDVRVQPTDSGYVQEHVVSGVMRGEPFRTHVGLITWLRDARIVRLHEYFSLGVTPG